MNPHFIFSLFYFNHEFMMCLQFLTSGAARVTLLYIKKSPKTHIFWQQFIFFYIREGILNKHLMANTPVVLIQMNSNEVGMSAWFLVCSSSKKNPPKTHTLPVRNVNKQWTVTPLNCWSSKSDGVHIFSLDNPGKIRIWWPPVSSSLFFWCQVSLLFF